MDPELTGAIQDTLFPSIWIQWCGESLLTSWGPDLQVVISLVQWWGTWRARPRILHRWPLYHVCDNISDAIVWHSPCMLRVSVCGCRVQVQQSQCQLRFRVQVGIEIGARFGQCGSQTLYKLVKYGWWHPYEVLKCTRVFIPHLHHQLLMQSKLNFTHDPYLIPRISWKSSDSLLLLPSITVWIGCFCFWMRSAIIWTILSSMVENDWWCWRPRPRVTRTVHQGCSTHTQIQMFIFLF